MKLLTLNIEGHKHLEDVTRLIAEQKPDVIALQEVFESDLSLFAQTLKAIGSYTVEFVANATVTKPNDSKIDPLGPWGVALFVRDQLLNGQEDGFTHHFYQGDESTTPVFAGPMSLRRALLIARIQIRDQSLAVMTTHFTWSAEGQTSAQQQRDVKQLQVLLHNYNRYILCGDFNAPRGHEIYKEISHGLTDHLPSDVVTTLDAERHYAGVLNLVVDSVFSTPDIHSIKTEVIGGVSDHKAVVVEFAL